MANLAITPAQVIPSSNASLQRAAAGAEIDAGDLVYKDSTGLLQLSDADGVAAAQDVKGVAVCSGGAGQIINYIPEDDDLTVGDNVVAGTSYFLSATAGKMAADGDLSAGARKIFVGVGKAGGKMNFRPVAGGIIPAP